MGCILDLKTTIDVSNRLVFNKEKIVFTHGAFDLFHIGHAALLKESKKKGDFLVVGLESDERIYKYKNKGRPVISLRERMKIVAENRWADFVFPIDDNTQLNERFYVDLYISLKPNVVTCGKHFSFKEQFVKRDKHTLLEKVKFSSISHSYDEVQSTTNIINKIKNVSC